MITLRLTFIALGVCEAFALADSLGLDLDSFFKLCSGAAAHEQSFTKYTAVFYIELAQG